MNPSSESISNKPLDERVGLLTGQSLPSLALGLRGPNS